MHSGCDDGAVWAKFTKQMGRSGGNFALKMGRSGPNSRGNVWAEFVSQSTPAGVRLLKTVHTRVKKKTHKKTWFYLYQT